jgi:ankyrin repeat protein
VAGAEGNLKVLEFLIKKGMSPSVDAIGASPLHWAAFSGHVRYSSTDPLNYSIVLS